MGQQLVLTRFMPLMPRSLVFILLLAVTALSHANTLDNNTNVKSVNDLDWGVVLYNYYQQNYFAALIEHEYVSEIGNSMALNSQGQVLKGGMQLSYGMADESLKLFEQVLASNVEEKDKNRAWFYLAKLYYHKSDNVNAMRSLAQIKGTVPSDVYADYHYMATLIHNDSTHLIKAENLLANISSDNAIYPYLLFNIAISKLKAGKLSASVDDLERVVRFGGSAGEYATLADRARHGLAQIAIQNGRMGAAWAYLKEIRTSGLYSNRALLTYAWSAIKLKQFTDAIPALDLLSSRSIAIPEVQEAKVLLAHLYEQQGSPRKALEGNLLAINAFEKGVGQVEVARELIKQQQVPREYIENLRIVMENSDWYGTKPTVSYNKLTPFLIDLMASNVFNETLKELSDLYSIQKNLEYWMLQAQEHLLILKNAGKKTFTNEKRTLFVKIESVKNKLAEKSTELRLHALTLKKGEQKRLQALVESYTKELELLKDKVGQLKSVEQAYKQPEHYKLLVASKHAKIKARLKETKQYIAVLEPVVRSMVNAELSKHEERMRYYWAQSRLAKARLYDAQLMKLESAQQQRASEKQSKEKKEGTEQ